MSLRDRIAMRHWIFSCLVLSLLLAWAPACRQTPQPRLTPTQPSTSTPRPTLALTLTATRVGLATATAFSTPHAPTATVPLTGPAVMEVQFALDVDPTGELVFPAANFVFGVTRVYVRFSFRGMANVRELQTTWYLNENPVSTGRLAWDGGDAGDYIIWVEDPNGLGRGEWRWEPVVDGQPVGGGGFAVGGEPGYTNESWGVSFDPPATWEMASEEEGFVTFSSPDGGKALALQVAPENVELADAAATDLTSFQEDHPDAEVVVTGEMTMGGEKALLHQVTYTDEQGSEQSVFVVSAVHAGSGYSLWVLGPAEEVATLKRLLILASRSLRFAASE